MAGTHCNNSSRPGQRDRVGRVFRVGRFNLGEDFDAGAHPLNPGPADKHGMHRRHAVFRCAELKALEVQVRFKGLPLPAEGVAAHRYIEAAEGLLRRAGEVRSRVRYVGGQENHPCAGAVHRQPARDAVPQRPGQFKGAGQFVDGGGFPAGNDQAVQAVQLGWPAHGNGVGAAVRGGAEVLAEVALKRQDTDPQPGSGARGSS